MAPYAKRRKALPEMLSEHGSSDDVTHVSSPRRTNVEFIGMDGGQQILS
tara:strand:+ start:1081 stop:1227 length:147 start_codon:yes stop_codon:yes gene_type:complete